MSEFRLTGNSYVSEWNGDNSNSGSNPDTPFKNFEGPSSNIANTTIAGTGVYPGQISKLQKIKGDGKVVIDCNNGIFMGAVGQPGGVIFENLHIKNFTTLPSGRYAFSDCILENGNSATPERNSCFRNIILPNSIGIFVINGDFTFHSNNLFFENTEIFFSSVGLQFNFLEKGKYIIYKNNSASFLNNMINGIIKISGTDYELKFLFDGSPRPDADPSIADLATASGFSNVYTNGNFAGDPKFIDVLNRIVAPDSDLLKRSNTNGFIGGVRAGRVIPVSTTEPNVTLTSERINTSDPQNWVIQTSEDDGWIDMKFRVSSQIVQCPVINFIAQLAFDGSVAGGTAGNNNVPDATPESYTPLSQPNLKPNRLVYLFRSSKSVNMPTTDAGWDNDGDTIGTPVIAGDFYAMEWSNGNRVAPFIRINGGLAYGNSNFESPGGAENFINVRWVNIRIRLTDLRSYA